MSKIKVIAIMGQAGSGKDSIMKGVLRKNPLLNEIISCTTRPQREGEKDGINYYFLSVQDFTKKVLDNEMLECTTFNDWFYGTPYDSLSEEKINIGVFNPTGVENLINSGHIDELVVYYVVANDKTRLLRQLNREEMPDVNEIVRRFKTDKEDFADLDFEYEIIYNETADDFDKCVNTILKDINFSFSPYDS